MSSVRSLFIIDSAQLRTNLTVILEDCNLQLEIIILTISFPTFGIVLQRGDPLQESVN